MPDRPAARAHDSLEPGIRRFVDEVSAGFAGFAALDSVSFPEARRIAEAVRSPWRAGGPVMRTITERLVPAAGGHVRVRVYDPGPAGRKPALVYLHGGGWTLFSIDTHDRVMREYAARAGVNVVGVDYSLSPEAKFPKALDETVAVVRCLREQGPGLGIDPERIDIGGDSAGGNLAIACCIVLRDAGESGYVKAMLLNYGSFDIVNSEDSARRYGGAGFMLSFDEMQAFWQNYMRGPEDAGNPLVCPLRAGLEKLPPAFLTIPECDLLTEQSLAMAGRLRAAGVAVRAEVYQGASHSFLEAVSVSEVADRALTDGAQWLARNLRPRPD